MDHPLRHRQGALADVNYQQHLALGIHGRPYPRGRAIQALDGLSLADRTVLDRTEQGKQLIELDLSDSYVVQEVLREGLQLLRRLHEPLQDRIRVHLEHPCRASDAEPLSQARDDPHDEVDRGALPMKNRVQGLQKIAATGDAQQLPPGTAIGMAIGAEIAPAHPAAIGTGRVRAEMA
jgi:hypothetical protein